MGLFDNLGEILEKAGNALGEEVKKQKNVYDSTTNYSQNMNDERLIKKFKEEHDVTKKVAMANELKRRGYGKKDE